MGTYDLYIFCDECGDVHRMGKGITLEDGPIEKASLEQAYADRSMPPEIAALINSRIQCPETKRTFSQQDSSQVFLVPVVFV